MGNTVGLLHEHLVFNRRTRVLAAHLSALMPRDACLLDVGCGDGTIDTLMLNQRPDISIRGVDVLVRPATKIPVDPFDGERLPCADKSFDVVCFVDVLHHTNDPTVLLKEAKRVARKLVVIKDHTMDGWLAYATLRFMDWVGNAHHGVVLPYNYWPEQRWRATFSALDMPIARWEPDVGLYPYPASLVFGRRLHFVAAIDAA
jgi:SAM-dependent methyltransferase